MVAHHIPLSTSYQQYVINSKEHVNFYIAYGLAMILTIRGRTRRRRPDRHWDNGAIVIKSSIEATPLYSSLIDLQGRKRVENVIVDRSIVRMLESPPIIRSMLDEAAAYYDEINF